METTKAYEDGDIASRILSLVIRAPAALPPTKAKATLILLKLERV